MKAAWRILLLACVLALAVAPSFVRAAVPATPATIAGCAANPDLAQYPSLLPEPPGVVRQYVIAGETSTGTTFTDALAATYCINADTAVTVDGSPDIHQRGVSVVTVIEGSLTVTLVGRCAELNCTTAAGTARIGHVETNNQVSWTELGVGIAATLRPGDTAIFADVLITAAAGPDQTTVATLSTVQNSPGGGCLASCWQFG
jgi:hypothetical protein